jgi:hypothetical protein
LFWHDKWMDGVSPVCIAPNLFKKAHFKQRSVAKELQNNNWMSVARHISTRQELLEFVKLWSLLKNVWLRSQEKDTIIWKWEESGEYSAASAYKIQFQGSHPPFKIGQL